MATFAERLTEALSVRHVTAADLSRRLGVNEGTISNYKKGVYIPKQRRLEAIAKELNVSIGWLMGNDIPIAPFSSNKRINIIPVLGSVPAGIPIEAIEDILDYEEIDDKMARSGEHFALRIKGSSMEPKFSEGDVVIVRKQERVENGEIAVVMVNGDEATVKKFYKSAAGVQLIGTNPAFTPIVYTPEEVETLPVRVIGKVVELRAKF